MMSCFLVLFFVPQVKETGSCYVLPAFRDLEGPFGSQRRGLENMSVAALPVHNSSMSMFNIDIQTI